MKNVYETIIGIEVHAELKTKTKIFCSCENKFGAPPNTCCCHICMGFPGALPVLNKKVIEYAVRAGTALGCTVSDVFRTDRKNYFYPDLPKGYQISQYKYPICENGYLEVCGKKIGIERIHFEEDAGKLIHNENGTFIDFNRCGVPLIEIVSKPDLRSADEAVEYLKNLRSVLMYTGVSDCRMNEGSFRCDVNISVRKKGEGLGVKCEIKNLNSFRFVKKAIEYEADRQIKIYEDGKKPEIQTMRFENGKTVPMRSKENSGDYRYFPEPDLPPVFIPCGMKEKMQSDIPELPQARKKRYESDYNLPEHDAEMLISDKNISDYFDSAVGLTKYPKKFADFIISECFGMTDTYEPQIPVKAEKLAEITELFGDGKINSTVAKKLIFLLKTDEFDVYEYIKKNNLMQLCDKKILNQYISEAIDENQKLINDYKNGKTSAVNSVMGKVMAKTNGRGNPKIISELLDKKLKNL